MSDELNYFYPPNTPGSTLDGFYHRLNDDQKEALLSVQKWVIENDVDMALLASQTLHPTLTLLRYLRANNFDIDKAIAHMKANIAYRADMKVDELITKTPDEILGCSMEKLMEVFPHWHCGYDKTGRPVLYKQYAKFDVTAIKKMVCIHNYDSIQLISSFANTLPFTNKRTFLQFFLLRYFLMYKFINNLQHHRTFFTN
jgi:hypothetical protein